MSNLNIINENLDKLVFDGEPLFEDNIYLEKILCDLILTNRYPNDLNIKNDDQIYECRNKISLEQSIKMCRAFLENINHKYALIFDSLIENNKIFFEKTNDVYQSSYTDFTSENEFIKIYLLNNINDPVTMAHEFMHYINFGDLLATEVTSYYTEAFSNFIELVMIDYIVNNYPKYKKDALKVKRSIFISIYEKNIQTKVVLELIKKKIRGLTISSYDVLELIKEINSFCSDLNLIEIELKKIIDLLLEDAEGAYILSTRDTIGLVLGCYMYELSKNKYFYKQIFELNDNLHEFYYDEVLIYLGLELDENLLLSDESSQKLIKSYKNELKKLW